MSTITAIFEPAPDGTLHLPLPVAWQKLPIRVQAVLEPVTAPNSGAPPQHALKGFGCLKGKISMTADFDAPPRRKSPVEHLRGLHGLEPVLNREPLGPPIDL